MLDAGTAPTHKPGSNAYRKGCRCPECRAVMAAKERRRYRDRAIGRNMHNRPATTAARIITKHRAAGISWPDLAKATGLAKRTLADIANGNTRTVTAVTEQAILKAQPTISPTTRTNATGTARRLQGLALLGYGPTHVANLAGVSADSLSRVINGYARDVQIATHDAVEAAARTLTRQGPVLTRHGKGCATLARRAGYTPLLMWDDIDDPTAVPWTPAADDVEEATTNARRSRTDPDIIDHVWRLHGQGMSDREIAGVVGYATAGAVCKLRARHPRRTEQ